MTNKRWSIHGIFSNNKRYNFETKRCEKISIQCWDSNSQPLNHEPPLQRSSEICFLEFHATNVYVAVDLLTSFNRSYRGQKFFSRTVSFLSSRKKSFRQNNFDFKMKLCRIPLADNTKPLVKGSLYCWCTV